MLKFLNTSFFRLTEKTKKSLAPVSLYYVTVNSESFIYLLIYFTPSSSTRSLKRSGYSSIVRIYYFNMLLKNNKGEDVAPALDKPTPVNERSLSHHIPLLSAAQSTESLSVGVIL